MTLGLLFTRPLFAQERAPTSRPALWLGAGSAIPLSEPNFERNAGLAGMAALELPARPRLWLRVEASGSTQQLGTRRDSPVRGDVQQTQLSVAARYELPAGRIAPYALAGAGLFWQSDRVILRSVDNPVPDAEYRMTTSHTAAGPLLGAGATATVARARLFAEARWSRIGGDGGPTTNLALIGGVTCALPW
ncbi:MAG TPA: hypothetical protein VHQ45_18635 [Gemmatimonadaceae bacterium]|nr:hypothetical protein [Gemmatimonadaceae bacterium]